MTDSSTIPRRHGWVRWTTCLVLILLLLGWREYRADPRQAHEDPWRVWIAVTKGFNGPVYYLGSDASYSYFRIGSYLPKCYKVKSDEISLPQSVRFPLKESVPLQITDHKWVAWKPPAGH